jgi:hypothetical protein
MSPSELKSMTTVQRQFLAARDVSAPLVVIRTADPAATVAAIGAVAVTPADRPAPVVQWDCAAGFQGANAQGIPVARSMGDKNVRNPLDALEKAGAAPEHTTLVMLNLHEFMKDDPMIRQAIWNLRDPFKKNWRTLVMTQQEGGVPLSLEHDVLIIDEPLPGSPELRTIIEQTMAAAHLPKPDEKLLARAVEAVSGLSAFAAEQAVALSLRTSGLDVDALRERHRQMIENTKGLYVWRGGEKFDDLGGLGSFKKFAQRVIDGRYRFGCVFWIDEIEKAFGGLRGDLTGITQDYLGVLLSFMQDLGIPGILLMGHPGTGKSALSKALGNTAGVPTIRADLQAMHGSLVGQSQHALRHALRVVTAVSQGRPLFVATCNSVAVLPPEFVNRFKWRFFVDLPDDAEKKVIWPIHLKKRGLDLKQERPFDGDWNGREIEQCCETAYQLQCSLVEAAEFVVPIAQSSAEQIELRRREAHGRYLSASRTGPYNHEDKPVVIGGRQIKLKENDPTWAAPGSSKPN